MKNVLLIGGTGFVGMNIAEALLERGCSVVLFARHPFGDKVLDEFSRLKGKLDFFRGDVLDADSIREAIETHDIADIIHGAALTPSREMEMERPRQVMEINCIGLMNALDEARRAAVDRFIYLGSVSAYGNTCFTQKVLVEGRSVADPHSLYELSKFTGERVLQRYRDLYGMDAIVARVGDVYGPWERDTGARSYMSLPFQILQSAMLGRRVVLPKPNCIDWVYGRDVAQSVIALMESGALKHDIYPICSGWHWSLIDWCRKVEAQFPGFEWSMASEAEPATIRVNQIEDNASMQTDRLIEDTGYRPRYDLDEAFQDYMAWVARHRDFIVPQ